MTNLRVAACKRTSVLPDGSLIEMDLQGSDKEAVTLQFDVDMFDEFLGRLMQLIADARNRKHAKSGQPGVPALPTAAAGAGPTADGNHVILLMKSHTGTEFQFALPTHGAEQLAQHIQTAVAAARQAQQARH